MGVHLTKTGFDLDERERSQSHRARKPEKNEREGGRNERQRRRECWTGLGWDFKQLKKGIKH